MVKSDSKYIHLNAKERFLVIFRKAVNVFVYTKKKIKNPNLVVTEDHTYHFKF